MKKIEIDPQKYRDLGRDFCKVKKLGLSQFIRWVASIYQSGYDDGWNGAMDSYKETNGGIAIDESVEAEVIDSDLLMEILLSVKGIGKKRAQEVIDKICKGWNDSGQGCDGQAVKR